LIWQVNPAARVAPQVPPKVKSAGLAPITLMPVMLNVLELMFWSVTGCEALGLLTSSLAKVSELGETTPAANTTVRPAVEVFPVPPLVEVTVALLVTVPLALVPTTLTEKVHEVEGARLAPARLTVEEPAVAVIVPPPHVPLRPLGEATATPAGRLLVNPIPVTVVLALGLLILKVRLVTPVTAMVPVPKDSLIDGGLTTVREAEAVLPAPPLVEITVTLLLMAPAVFPVTLSVMVQDASVTIE